MEIVWEAGDYQTTLEEHASVNEQRVATVVWNFAYKTGDDRYEWYIWNQTMDQTTAGFALTLERAKAVVEDQLRRNQTT